MNTVEFMRKYADIINEAQQPEQLNEGMLDSLVQKVKGAMSKIPHETLTQVIDLVEKALGKPASQLTMADITVANAKKVLAANSQMAEAEVDPPKPGTFPKGTTIPVHYSQGNKGIEYGAVPGSLAKNQSTNTKIGGVLGLIIGAMGGAFIAAPAAAIGVPVAIGAATVGIILAVIGGISGSPDYFKTGRARDSRGNIMKAQDYDPNGLDDYDYGQAE
jgi:hypothetical protein